MTDEREAHLLRLLGIANARIVRLEAGTAEPSNVSQAASGDTAPQSVSQWPSRGATEEPLGLAWLARASGAGERDAILEGAEDIGVGLFPAEPE